jgi:hypothetical protein
MYSGIISLEQPLAEMALAADLQPASGPTDRLLIAPANHSQLVQISPRVCNAHATSKRV